MLRKLSVSNLYSNTHRRGNGVDLTPSFDTYLNVCLFLKSFLLSVGCLLNFCCELTDFSNSEAPQAVYFDGMPHFSLPRRR